MSPHSINGDKDYDAAPTGTTTVLALSLRPLPHPLTLVLQLPASLHPVSIIYLTGPSFTGVALLACPFPLTLPIFLESHVQAICWSRAIRRSNHTSKSPLCISIPLTHHSPLVTVPSVTLAHKVGPGLQDLQTRARRILAERNAEKAEENTWIGRMVAAESIGELDGLIKSRAA